MRIFEDMPIRRKLTLVIMLTSAIGLLLSGAIIIAYERGAYRQRMVEDAETLGKIIGDQSTAALLFHDSKTSQETLAALKGKHEIRAAAIYDADGKLFAAYTRRDLRLKASPNKPELSGYRFSDTLEAAIPIEQDGENLGTIYLQSGLGQMQAQLAHHIGVIAGLTAALLLATLLLSVGVQRTIADPIVELAKATHTVSENKDYSLRVPQRGRDEIGELIGTFNEMLARIEESDSSLRASETNFRALVENGIIGVYIVQDEQYVYLNQRMAEIYGYSIGEMMAMGPSMDLVAPEDRDMVENNVRRRLAGQEGNLSYGFRGLRKDGRIIYIEGHASSAEIRGKPARIGMLLDITARKQSEEELRSLLTNARCILWRAWVTGEEGWREDIGNRKGTLKWRFMVPDEQAAQRVLPFDQPEGSDYMTVWLRARYDEDRLRVAETTSRALVKNLPNYSQEYRCTDKNGHVRWMREEVTVKALTGNRWDMFGVTTDISELKIVAEGLRQSEQRLREVMTHTNCMLWSGTVRGLPGWQEHTQEPDFFDWKVTMHAEASAQAMVPLEVPPGTNYMVAWTNSRLREDHDKADITALTALVNGDDRYVQEYRCRDRNGRLCWMNEEVSVQKIDTGQWKVFGVITDISRRKQSEEELAAYAQKLEQSNRELQDFAYVSSHDLQEPLRAIQNFSERLRTKHEASLDESGRDYLLRMQNAASRMRVLIQDLLAYSRVTTKARPFLPTDLNAIAKTVMADLTVRLEETEGRIELGELPVIEADFTQMRQLIQNLLGNALKFHRPGVPPVVKVCASPVESDDGKERMLIIVEDNGIGFDEKYCDRIFAPFQRLHGQRKYEGTGIGLAICRKIVERHGGDITATSVPEQGTKFLVTLPVHQPKVDSNVEETGDEETPL